MTREIKFRMWNPHAKKMITNPKYLSLKQNEVDVNEIFTSVTAPKGKEKTHWMQYTGLKDKNGTEVWEGDLLRYEDKGSITNSFGGEEVEWDDERAAWATFSSTLVGAEVIRMSEVIGNKYEDPDLLEPNEYEYD